jgi:hypothetical protein
VFSLQRIRFIRVLSRNENSCLIYRGSKIQEETRENPRSIEKGEAIPYMWDKKVSINKPLKSVLSV